MLIEGRREREGEMRCGSELEVCSVTREPQGGSWWITDGITH